MLDGDHYSNIVKHEGIRGFPTIRLYSAGRMVPFPSSSPRSDSQCPFPPDAIILFLFARSLLSLLLFLALRLVFPPAPPHFRDRLR